MIQTIPGSEIRKPSDDEIARVVAWQKVTNFMEVNKAAEAILDDPNAIHIMGFMGEVVDERFTKRALIGMIHHFARKAGVP